MDYRKIPIDLLMSEPDERDYPVSKLGVMATSALPDDYMIPYLPEPYDQGASNMCLAFTLAKIKEFQEWKERGRVKKFSPGFIYSYRLNGGEGMYMRVGLNILRKYGVCEKELFPNVGTFESMWEEFFDKKSTLIAEAAPQRIKAYARAWTEEEIKKSLIDNGPMAIGASLYENFYDANHDGMVPMPEGKIIGGHAMMLVGWIKIGKHEYWVVSNSWGKDWGDNGLCYIPIEYPNIEFWTCIDEASDKLQGKRVVMRIGDRKYEVNGKQKEMRIAPFTQYIKDPDRGLDGDVTFVPVREVAEALGAEVTWTPVNPDLIEIEM